MQQSLLATEKAFDRTERAVRDEISTNRTESSAAARHSREELHAVLKEMGNRLGTQLEQIRQNVEHRLTLMQEVSGKRLDQMRQEAAGAAAKARDEVNAALKLFADQFRDTLTEIGGTQRSQLGNVVDQLTRLTEATEKKLDSQRSTVDERLKQIQLDGATSAKATRDDVTSALKTFEANLTIQVEKLSSVSEQRLDALRISVEEKLKGIQEDNAKQLEQMRATVDEKLQGSLEKRLGEAFKLVSDRLEQVHKGLGEMQTLAIGVGDLKKVLTNVKARGTWGEVQLGAMLEEVLALDQYARNVSVKGDDERVEFAVKLPGRSDAKDDVLWLPIDAKFPVEDYQRLVEAQERGDNEAVEGCARQLEARIKGCAKDLCDKYLNPPVTTDFGILFLPTEGLFAEVVRRLGLPEYVQRQCRVVIAGPTTLWSILSSLQMGFRTLAIQKRSSEVWALLAAVKTEWGRYGEVLAKVQKKLNQASNTLDQAQTRTRVIGRKLNAVQELPQGEARTVLQLGEFCENGNGDGEAKGETEVAGSA